jgi:pimeloyl-ACP methyl ester carboxylesterase
MRIVVWTGLGLIGLMVLAATAGLTYRAIRQRRCAEALAIRTPNGVAEGMFVRIGGIDQWISIRGENVDNPILLVLAGGPGMSYVSFAPVFRSWEQYFTVVQWDRRGVGKTYGRNGKAKSGPLTFPRMAQDGIEVSEFLRRRLHKDKIVLLGHSMGSWLGVSMATMRPDLFSAYVGTDQMVDMARNEAVSYSLAVKRARESGDEASVRAVNKIGPPPYKNTRAWWAKQQWIMANDPAAPDVEQKIFLPLSLFSPDYSLKDIVNNTQGYLSSARSMFPEIMAYDVRQFGTRFEMPVFLFQGESDFLTPTVLAQEYFRTIEAPRKEMVLLKGGGHLTMITMPDSFLKELVDRVYPLVAKPTRRDWALRKSN